VKTKTFYLLSERLAMSFSVLVVFVVVVSLLPSGFFSADLDFSLPSSSLSVHVSQGLGRHSQVNPPPSGSSTKPYWQYLFRWQNVVLIGGAAQRNVEQPFSSITTPNGQESRICFALAGGCGQCLGDDGFWHSHILHPNSSFLNP